jgi:hypothetical protein
VTLGETAMMIRYIKAVYPVFTAQASRQDTEAQGASRDVIMLDDVLHVWQDFFSGIPAEIAFAAVKDFAASDRKGLPPVPGQILGIIKQKQRKKEFDLLFQVTLDNMTVSPETEKDFLPAQLRLAEAN